jgi:hypothetical protein
MGHLLEFDALVVALVRELAPNDDVALAGVFQCQPFEMAETHGR